MSRSVISVQNVSKQYRLGTIGTGTFSHDLNRLWHRMRGKDDPYQIIGEENDRTKKGSSKYVWALKDVSFDLKQGEVLGVIGRNGAGKSTLLKILSRTTLPTEGEIKIKGRIASLLEVGTGFHPELTGKENIFLNGAILGMTKAEIRQRFDEIVDFAGVERYIDTPVKRYSSGMYVRLAFAVAAHLDPEILIVDEVLAVGDSEFQQKCLGKMQDVSKNHGRTVLFVSHNMTAVSSLCNVGLVMSNGTLAYQGTANEAIDFYTSNIIKNQYKQRWLAEERPGDSVVKMNAVSLVNKNHLATNSFDLDEPIGVNIDFEVLSEELRLYPNVHIFTRKNDYLFFSALGKNAPVVQKKGRYNTTVWIPEHFLNEGGFKVSIAITSLNPTRLHCHEQEVLSFDVIEEDFKKRNSDYNQKLPGFFRPVLNWDVIQQPY
jgi:lipopolysaccharide transport system ATP-binding protein